MRTSLIVGLVAVVLGLAGLVRGSVPLSTNDQGSSAPVSVVDAWVAAPVPPTKAAAGYFTVYNNSGSDVELLKVTTSAGATNTLHTMQLTFANLAPLNVTAKVYAPGTHP
jgi:copper(I)-binding protein